MFWLLSGLLQALGSVTLLIIGAVIRKIWFSKDANKVEIKLQKPNWEKDVVYLCQFPLCPSVRTISPFSLKLETWLRMSEIKYENIFTKDFHPKTGQIPYIELNGEQYGDSNMIIKMLETMFSVEIDSKLTVEQKSMSHAVTSMMENYTAQTGFHYRYGYHMEEFLSKLKLSEYYGSSRAVWIWSLFQPSSTKLRNFMSGLSRHENSVIWDMAGQDFMSLSNWLGSEQYFHGSEPSTVDCMLFGHLAQFLFIDIGFPQKTYLENNCQNLVAHVERMKTKYWPDWEETIEESKQIYQRSIQN